MLCLERKFCASEINKPTQQQQLSISIIIIHHALSSIDGQHGRGSAAISYAFFYYHPGYY